MELTGKHGMHGNEKKELAVCSEKESNFYIVKRDHPSTKLQDQQKQQPDHSALQAFLSIDCRYLPIRSRSRAVPPTVHVVFVVLPSALEEL